MVTVMPILIGAPGTIPKGLIKRLEDLEIRGGNHPDDSIVEISQNTEKSSGNHQITLVRPPTRVKQ